MSRHQGFTLVEMAVVLVIFGLIIGALLIPMSAQRDIQYIESNRDKLKTISDALIGFVVLNGRLPCPAISADVSLANGGVEDCSSSTQGLEGFLPWRTLHVDFSDAWRRAWRYRVDQGFTNVISFSTNMLASPTTPSLFVDALDLQDANGNSLLSTSSPERPLAIVFSTGKNLLADERNGVTDSIYQVSDFSPTYDDMLIWIARPVLLNKLVSAGRLP
ncbi:type II secretion system GspH family protein [Methylobacillus gramineus]|uniref:type II secretion system protein n=1 Tax=Methylobacillus gramineus TaxID=755169 RepID=UPI001D000103|nr:type II secretion system protein [Methylobacillus gramineus]MCB5185448.1 type II secretion system GspH family protein [Methylobacillus gramineus]